VTADATDIYPAAISDIPNIPVIKSVVKENIKAPIAVIIRAQHMM
jgi:hypothetical protein